VCSEKLSKLASPSHNLDTRMPRYYECMFCKRTFKDHHTDRIPKYCSKVCESKGKKGGVPWNKGLVWDRMKGNKNPAYRGGRTLLWSGRKPNFKRYWAILMPEHHEANGKGYVKEHRYIMELYLGRKLKREEVVHHINSDTMDNRIENLELYLSHGEHMRHEWATGTYKGRKKTVN
jgi:hypothetical protein